MRCFPTLIRRNSLFARLLILQTGLVLLFSLVMAALFYVDRNRTIAVLYAEQWAPQLVQAAATASDPHRSESSVLQSRTAPVQAYRPTSFAPRFVAMRQALTDRGVPVDDLMLSVSGAAPVVWVRVVAANREPIWLGMVGLEVAPEWSQRTPLAVALTMVLVAGLSWMFTRRLTRPIEQLRARIESHIPGFAARNPGPQSSGRRSGDAVPEIVAIEDAYTNLLTRINQHERERVVLLAGVSHDLRSPLGRIRVATELLPDSEGMRARKDSIVRNVGELDRLIESFLDYVRAGELAFDETVDMVAIARKVIASFECAEHDLDMTAPPELLLPQANRLLVQRLMSNLIDNALKYGKSPVRLTLGATATHAWIDIQDAGAGIDPELTERMQEAFTRGECNRAVSGSGLGLAIVRQVAMKLGGEVTFSRREAAHSVRVTWVLQKTASILQ